VEEKREEKHCGADAKSLNCIL